MANATKYVDNVNGNNANTGDSEAQAYASIATALAAVTGGGNVIHLQNTGTPYTLTAAASLAANGDSTNGRNRIEGYTTTPGARDGRPTVTCATNSVSLFDLPNGAGNWDIVHIQGTHTAGTRGAFLSTSGTAGQAGVCIEDCLCDGCSYLVDASARPIGQVSGSSTCLTVRHTTARNCTTGVIINGGANDVIDGCLFYANAGIGYSANNSSVRLMVSDTVFSGGTKAISDGNVGSMREFGLFLVNCSFRGQSGSAIVQENTNANWTVYANRNNVFWSIGGYCWSLLDSAVVTLFNTGASGAGRNNFYGSVTSGYQNNYANGVGLTTLTADPFVDAANGNFALNVAAGGGAACRGAGAPGAFPGTTTTGYPDAGAAQHYEPTAAEVAAAVWAHLDRTLTA